MLCLNNFSYLSSTWFTFLGSLNKEMYIHGNEQLLQALKFEDSSYSIQKRLDSHVSSSQNFPKTCLSQFTYFLFLGKNFKKNAFLLPPIDYFGYKMFGWEKRGMTPSLEIRGQQKDELHFVSISVTFFLPLLTTLVHVVFSAWTKNKGEIVTSKEKRNSHWILECTKSGRNVREQEETLFG